MGKRIEKQTRSERTFTLFAVVLKCIPMLHFVVGLLLGPETRGGISEWSERELGETPLPDGKTSYLSDAAHPKKGDGGSTSKQERSCQRFHQQAVTCNLRLL